MGIINNFPIGATSNTISFFPFIVENTCEGTPLTPSDNKIYFYRNTPLTTIFNPSDTISDSNGPGYFYMQIKPNSFSGIYGTDANATKLKLKFTPLPNYRLVTPLSFFMGTAASATYYQIPKDIFLEDFGPFTLEIYYSAPSRITIDLKKSDNIVLATRTYIARGINVATMIHLFSIRAILYYKYPPFDHSLHDITELPFSANFCEDSDYNLSTVFEGTHSWKNITPEIRNYSDEMVRGISMSRGDTGTIPDYLLSKNGINQIELNKKIKVKLTANYNILTNTDFHIGGIRATDYSTSRSGDYTFPNNTVIYKDDYYIIECVRTDSTHLAYSISDKNGVVLGSQTLSTGTTTPGAFLFLFLFQGRYSRI